MRLDPRSSPIVRCVLVGAFGATLIACGIPWGNLQNGSRADAAGRDVTATLDAHLDASDISSPSDALDLAATSDTIASDVPPIGIDVVRLPDVIDVVTLPDVVDVVDVVDVASMPDRIDVTDVQVGCYGVSATCSSTASCCEGLTCTGGACTSSCLTYSSVCTSGSCCPGMMCTFGFCMAGTCRGVHQSCGPTGTCCAGLGCVAGTCQCPIGESTCMAGGISFCADLNTSMTSCGSCGHRCGGGQTCVAGVCR